MAASTIAPVMRFMGKEKEEERAVEAISTAYHKTPVFLSDLCGGEFVLVSDRERKS
jgi:hypothetical protein